MSEFRRDPVSDRWVIIAPNRAARPEQFDSAASGRAPGRCPFCLDHEEDTPPAITSYARAASSPGSDRWQVRVVPNKYPAVDNVPHGHPSECGFYEARHGVGVHEVIIEAPDHITNFSVLDDEAAFLVFLAYRDRLRELSSDPRLKYAQIFKNSGSAAGASLEHTHSQLIGTPVVPTRLKMELARAEAFWKETGECVYCRMIQHEVEQGDRLVAERDGFIAFCPFASQFPYETWILPQRHTSRFEETADEDLGGLARLVRSLVSSVEKALNDPAFNYLIHTSPFQCDAGRCYHWHVEFFPRMTKTAGFEWGAGDYINTVSPEDAAAALRSAINER